RSRGITGWRMACRRSPHRQRFHERATPRIMTPPPLDIADYSVTSEAPQPKPLGLRPWLDEHGDYVIKSASVAVLIGLWYLGAALLPPSVMPAPHIVVMILAQEIRGSEIWLDTAISMTRIVLAFTLAMSVSIVLGFAMGLSKTAERFFDVWIVCGI